MEEGAGKWYSRVVIKKLFITFIILTPPKKNTKIPKQNATMKRTWSECSLVGQSKKEMRTTVKNVTEASLCCESDVAALHAAIRDLDDANNNKKNKKKGEYQLVFPTKHTDSYMSLLSSSGSDGKFLLNSFIGSDCILRKLLYMHLLQELLLSLDIGDVSFDANTRPADDMFCMSMLKTCIHQLASSAVESLVEETGLGESFVDVCRYSILYNVVPLRRKKNTTRKSTVATATKGIFDCVCAGKMSTRSKLERLVERFMGTTVCYEVVDSRRLVLLYDIAEHKFHAIDLDDYTFDEEDGSCHRKDKRSSGGELTVTSGLWHWDAPRFDSATGRLSFNSPIQMVSEDARRYELHRLMKDRANAANSVSCKIIVDWKSSEKRNVEEVKKALEAEDDVIKALESAREIAYRKTRKFNENIRMLVRNDHDTDEVLESIARFDPVDEAMRELLQRRRSQIRRPDDARMSDVRRRGHGVADEMETFMTRSAVPAAATTTTTTGTGARIGPTPDQYRMPVNPAFVSSDIALDRTAHAKHARKNFLSAADLLRNAVSSLEMTSIENEEYKKRLAAHDADYSKKKQDMQRMSGDIEKLKRFIASKLSDESSSASSSSLHGPPVSLDDASHAHSIATNRVAQHDLCQLQANASEMSVMKLDETERFCNASLKADAPDDEKTADRLSELFATLATHLFGLRRTHDATGNIVDWYVNPDMETILRGFIRKYTSMTHVFPSVGMQVGQVSVIDRLFGESPIGRYMATVMLQGEQGETQTI